MHTHKQQHMQINGKFHTEMNDYCNTAIVLYPQSVTLQPTHEGMACPNEIISYKLY